MRLAIVHYHLRRGGVTRVIASALEALGKDVEAVVLSSTEPAEALPCPVAVVPELAYCASGSAATAAALHAAMARAAARRLGGAPDLWHIHNHCLGKNVNFPDALRRLLDGGARALLQIHDFAEDGRPANYMAQRAPYDDGTFSGFARSLYPLAPQIGYAVLNGRDQRILAGAGVPPERLFPLPNAVAVPPLHPETEAGARGPAQPPLILYPTRAIRRKNLGELLLLAAVYPEFRYATTLAPDNPEWAPVYDGWVALAAELGLPVGFALGERAGNTFAGMVGEAAAMVTTSVAEGFGLAFLEPWLFGKPVIGRDLPEITADFKANGIALPDLYPEWPVPLDLFDLKGLRGRFIAAAQSLHAAYAIPLSEAAAAAAWEELTRGATIDFGSLDEPAQARVLRAAVSGGKNLRDRIKAPVDPAGIDTSVTAANTARIKEFHGLPRYGERLRRIYATLLEAPAENVGAADPGRMLEAFVSPGRVKLLRA
jgi:glycosyltransferase involved in cell wall biosynthesis